MRIRSIKPEFWRSNDISDLTPEDRLLYIGLWSYVDDNGVGIDELHIIVAELFARDHFDNPRETVARVSRGLQNIAGKGLVTRYQVAGKPYLYINTWEQHQRIDKPNKPRHPLPDADRDILATSSRGPREDVAPGTGEQGNRGTGEVGAGEQRASELALVPPAPSFDDFWATYPRKDDKTAARKAWDRATKHTDPQNILDGATRYAQDPNREKQFTKLPTTWLNAGAWDNEPIPDRANIEETPTQRIMRMRNNALAQLNGDANGNAAGMPQSAISARVS